MVKPASEVWQVRRDSNPQPSVLETDALPIELLTCVSVGSWLVGWFVVGSHLLPTIQLSNYPTGLHRLLMRRVFPAEPAVLAELQPFRRLLLVLGRAVVPALTVAARQVNDVA